MQIFHQTEDRGLTRLCRGTLTIVSIALFGLAAWPALGAPAQDVAGASAELAQSSITARSDSQSDIDIRDRIRSIFSEVPGLRNIQVRVGAGVVTLSGTVATTDDIERATAIAARVAGVVTVQNEVERALDVDSNLTPTLGKFADDVRGLVRGLPLMGVALVIAVLVGAFGYLLASFAGLWRHADPLCFCRAGNRRRIGSAGRDRIAGSGPGRRGRDRHSDRFRGSRHGRQLCLKSDAKPSPAVPRQ
jgi:hypothetical protein